MTARMLAILSATVINFAAGERWGHAPLGGIFVRSWKALSLVTSCTKRRISRPNAGPHYPMPHFLWQFDILI
jgi:hypothetical protein